MFLPPTDGTTGPQWVARLVRKDIGLSNWAIEILNSSDFRPTVGIVNCLAIIKGQLFADSERQTANVCRYAESYNLSRPNVEVACLFRDNYSDEEIEEMGLTWAVVMHKPVIDSVGEPRLLVAQHRGGGSRLRAYRAHPHCLWRASVGFAFRILPPAPAQT